MINNVILVGKLAKEPELKELQNGSKMCSLTLDVVRNFPSSDGTYQSDLIDVTAWRGIAEETASSVKVGDIISVKGRLSMYSGISKNGNEFTTLNVIAEDVSSMS